MNPPILTGRTLFQPSMDTVSVEFSIPFLPPPGSKIEKLEAWASSNLDAGGDSVSRFESTTAPDQDALHSWDDPLIGAYLPPISARLYRGTRFFVFLRVTIDRNWLRPDRVRHYIYEWRVPKTDDSDCHEYEHFELWTETDWF